MMNPSLDPRSDDSDSDSDSDSDRSIQHGWHGSPQQAAEDNTSNASNSAIGEVPAWFMDHVCVTLTNKDNAKGFISEFSGDGIATVILDESGEKENVRYTELALVKPEEHNMVVVTGGSDVGVEGELVCIDNTDAILKDSSEEYKIVDFVYVAKIGTAE